MVRFELQSDRDVLVAGIGLLPAGQPVGVSELDAQIFAAHQGVSLLEANFPSYVTLTAVLVNDDEEDGGV